MPLGLSMVWTKTLFVFGPNIEEISFEKHIAFIIGLDLFYGRWDANQRSIADARPITLNQIIYFTYMTVILSHKS